MGSCWCLFSLWRRKRHYRTLFKNDSSDTKVLNICLVISSEEYQILSDNFKIHLEFAAMPVDLHSLSECFLLIFIPLFIYFNPLSPKNDQH